MTTTAKPSAKLKRLITDEQARLRHCELRPENMCISGDVRLGDWGLAPAVPDMDRSRAFSAERIAQIAARMIAASPQPLILLDPKADNTEALAQVHALAAPEPKRQYTWIQLSKPKKQRARAG